MLFQEANENAGHAHRAESDGAQSDARRVHFIVAAAEGVRIPIDIERAVERAEELEKFRTADLGFLLE